MGKPCEIMPKVVMLPTLAGLRSGCPHADKPDAGNCIPGIEICF
jgi:hypothetical protein